jgi:hypothetical protein
MCCIHSVKHRDDAPWLCGVTSAARPVAQNRAISHASMIELQTGTPRPLGNDFAELNWGIHGSPPSRFVMAFGRYAVTTSSSDSRLIRAVLHDRGPRICAAACPLESVSETSRAQAGTTSAPSASSRELFDVEHVEVKEGVISMGRMPRSRLFAWTETARAEAAQPMTGCGVPKLRGQDALSSKCFTRALGVLQRDARDGPSS